MSDEQKAVGWLEDNYKGLLLGLFLGLSILFGYKSLLSSQNTAQLELSRQFDMAVNNFQKGETDQIIEYAKMNMTDNPENIYTALANLYSAKAMYSDNKIDEAYIFLDHIISNTSDSDIMNLAIYRKAKILIEQSDYSTALNILTSLDNYQHIELRGDIYLLQNNKNEALNHYNQVLAFEITPNERKNILAKINLVK
jgi:predicted negative regulator of RcsB-dependent stress response